MNSRLTAAATALLVIQVIHGAIPAETSSEGYVGAIVGAALVVASIVGIVGAVRNREWAAPLIGATGAIVAIGFLLYHVSPWHTPVTNPYFGEDKIGALQWTPVFLCIAAGAFAVYAARQELEREAA
ncbi:MAG TPA: hypothetical protein VFB78_11130 [Acidimicrobiales bacterium]|nr:hypothetical protein [Acidimicrobiales bacterium]